jgi:cytochrome bd-type quinol oxidase subunit 2
MIHRSGGLGRRGLLPKYPMFEYERPCEMASTSAVAVWRLVLLIGAPLAFAVTGTLHLVPASEPIAGSDFDHVVPHSSLWTGIHVVQLVIISLLALGVAALTEGLSGPASTVSRVALLPFVAFYSAFDASVGLSGGLLGRYVTGHPATREEVSQAANTVTDPLSTPVLAVVYIVGVLCWLVAVVGAAVATRRAGAALAGPIVLVIGAAIFALDHAAPSGPTGMVLWAVGAVMIDRRRAPRPSATSLAVRGDRET